ncbi:hypothetical protein BC833DRAFT_564324 [Globomyces pollinis-pini]|nr:hypothetical protein BC833DRAFT_564324 [Globomyces pollinis-pini]
MLKLFKPRLFARLIQSKTNPIQPKPIPLGNEQDQLEFENLVQKYNAVVDEDVSKGIQHPDYQKNTTQFEGEINPKTKEIGGPKGMEPTRYGDWERNGRVYDF